MKHLMVDIETMGNSSNSAIVSIAAVEFDLDTGDTGREFYINVDLQSCIDAGLILDASTVLWWMNQDKKAQLTFQDNPASLGVALGQFVKFVGRNNYKVWGNSARFDCGILQDAFKKIGVDICWDFWNERCLRTLVSFRPSIKEQTKFIGVKHNSIDDCKHQIRYASETWNYFKQ